MTTEELETRGYRIHEKCLRLLYDIGEIQKALQANNAELEKIRAELREKTEVCDRIVPIKRLKKNDRFPSVVAEKSPP